MLDAQSLSILALWVLVVCLKWENFDVALTIANRVNDLTISLSFVVVEVGVSSMSTVAKTWLSAGFCTVYCRVDIIGVGEVGMDTPGSKCFIVDRIFIMMVI